MDKVLTLSAEGTYILVFREQNSLVRAVNAEWDIYYEIPNNWLKVYVFEVYTCYNEFYEKKKNNEN